MMRKLFILLSFVVLFAISGTVVAAARPANVNVTITSSFDNDNKNLSHSITSLPVGNVFQLNASNIQASYTFAFWVINGVVRDDLAATDSIRLQTSMNIQAVFHKSGEYAVLFVDSNGKLISTQYVLENGSVTPPSYVGFTKPGLQVNSSEPWKSLQGATTFDNIQSSRVYVLQYTAGTPVSVTLSITGGVATPSNPNRNDLVTLVASDIPNFKYWKDGNGQVLSYQSTFVFTAVKDVTIIAETEDVKTPETLVTMSSDLAIRENYETYVGRFELEAGHELVEWGFLLSDETLGLLSFETPNVIIAKSNTYNPETNEFVMSFSEVTFSSIRAYVLINNGTSVEEILSAPTAIASDLLISEYIEGSSNNKAIEIFNGTGAPVDLSLYNLVQYNNGGSNVYILELSGTLQNGDTYVVANSSSSASILSKSDFTTSASIVNFNGNDAMAITRRADDSIVDIIGDPASSTDFAKDSTFVRKSSIISPNSIYSSSEWDSYPIDTTSYLGNHSIGSSTDSQKVVADANGLNLTNEVKQNTTLSLPSSGANGSTISWVSDTPDVITNAGVVTLPSGQPIVVIMTATVSLNGTEKQVAFEVTVGLTDLEKATADRDAISLTLNYTEATTIILSTSGLNGSTISWASDNALINTSTGSVTMPGSGQVEVTLTATIVNGSAELTKDFIITVGSSTQSEELLYSYNFLDGGSSSNEAYASTNISTNVSYAADNPGGTSGTTAWIANYANLSLTSGTRLGGKLVSVVSNDNTNSANLKTTFTYLNILTKVELLGLTTFGTAGNVGNIYLQVSTDGLSWTTVSTQTFASTITFGSLNVSSGSYIRVLVQITASGKNSGIQFTGLKVYGYPI
jgi:hypothetical protein